MRQPANGSSWEKIVKNILISCGIGLAVSVMLLFLVSALLRFINIPHALIDPAATAALCIGALAAGLVCAKLNREKGLICGLICAAVLFAVWYLCGALIFGGEIGAAGIFRLVFLLLCGAIGGVLGVNSKKKIH